jgi:uncharacterized protein (TIGR03083 family)
VSDVPARPSISKAAVVDALVGEWQALAELLDPLTEEEWSLPSPCPGWTVKDVAAHVIGTELTLEGQSSPALTDTLRSGAHIRNDIGAINEAWVDSFRSRPGPEVARTLREVTARRAAALEAMSPEEFDADSWTPAGPGSYGRFMQIRVYDCWVHEQDIRSALGRPGHLSGPAAEQSLDEVTRAAGYIVGKKAGAPQGSSVEIELTGPTSGRIAVAIEGRAAVVPELTGPPTAGVRMPFDTFMAMASGRVPADPQAAGVELSGDTDLAARVVTSLNFTI